MHYLEGAFDSAMEKISHYLVPDHQYKSIHDFFNPQLFHEALFAMLVYIDPDCPIFPPSRPILTPSYRPQPSNKPRPLDPILVLRKQELEISLLFGMQCSEHYPTRDSK